MNQTQAGEFYNTMYGVLHEKSTSALKNKLTCGFMPSATHVLTASLDGLVFDCDDGSRTMNAPTTSPYLLSGTATAAAHGYLGGNEVDCLS